MIEVIVSLNGEEFEVFAPGDVYDGERPDFNQAVASALQAHKVAYPLDTLESATLEVSVRRKFTDVATRDGEGVDTNRSPAVDTDVDQENTSEDPADFSEEELDELTDPDAEDSELDESEKANDQDHEDHNEFEAGDDRDVARDAGFADFEDADVRDEDSDKAE